MYTSSHKRAGQFQREFKGKRVKIKIRKLIIEKAARLSKITRVNGFGVLEVT